MDHHWDILLDNGILVDCYYLLDKLHFFHMDDFGIHLQHLCHKHILYVDLQYNLVHNCIRNRHLHLCI